MTRTETINFLRFTSYAITNVIVGTGTAVLTGTYVVGNFTAGVYTDLPNANNAQSVSHNVTGAETFATALGALRAAALAQEGLSLAAGDQGVF